MLPRSWIEANRFCFKFNILSISQFKMVSKGNLIRQFLTSENNISFYGVLLRWSGSQKWQEMINKKSATMLGITIQPSFAQIRAGDILHCGAADAPSSDQGWFLENYLCQSLSWHCPGHYIWQSLHGISWRFKLTFCLFQLLTLTAAKWRSKCLSCCLHYASTMQRDTAGPWRLSSTTRYIQNYTIQTVPAHEQP